MSYLHIGELLEMIKQSENATREAALFDMYLQLYVF